MNMSVDPLVRKVLDSVASELDITRSRLIETLITAGLRDIVKASGEADIPWHRDVERSVSGIAEANLNQQRVSDQVREGSIPRDNFAEFRYGQHEIVGNHAKPSYTSERVTVDSRYPQDSIYKAAFKAMMSSTVKGTVSPNEIKKVLGERVVDERIVAFVKALEEAVNSVADIDIRDIQKRQDQFAENFNETLKRHSKILGYDES